MSTKDVIFRDMQEYNKELDERKYVDLPTLDLSGLCRCGQCLECEKSRREELEVIAAALYLGHDDAKEQFDMYRKVYIK